MGSGPKEQVMERMNRILLGKFKASLWRRLYSYRMLLQFALN